MRTQPLGTTGVSVSEACLGAMRFGTKTSEETSFALLDQYLAAGGTFIDTANVYAAWEPGAKGGESETLLGRWMRARGHRDKLFLATKFGSRFQKSGFGLRAAQIEKEFEGSLKRLRVDHVELLYTHFEDRETPLEETLAALDRLVKAGKVRFLGASNHRAWRLEAARQLCMEKGWSGYVCVQQRFSYLKPHGAAIFGVQVAANEDLVEFCAARQLTLLAYSPLLGGCYARADKPVPKQYVGPQSDARLAALATVAQELGVSRNQVVLAWMRHLEPPVVPLIAASNAEQLKENLAALELKLTPDQMQRLNAAGT